MLTSFSSMCRLKTMLTIKTVVLTAPLPKAAIYNESVAGYLVKPSLAAIDTRPKLPVG
jgi:hypothetical protein